MFRAQTNLLVQDTLAYRRGWSCGKRVSMCITEKESK